MKKIFTFLFIFIMVAGLIQVQATSVDSIKIKTTGNVNVITKDADTLHLSVIFYPATASNKTFTWFVSDSTIASINTLGILTANKNGAVWIYAVSQDGNKKDSVQITVSNQWSVFPIANKLDLAPNYWGYGDYNANVRMSWNDTAIFMKVKIIDDTIFTGDQEWIKDNTELYIDMNNSKRIAWPRNVLWHSPDTTFDNGDYQLRVTPDEDFYSIVDGQNSTVANVVFTFSMDSVAGSLIGYSYYLAIPFSSLQPGFVPVAGKKIGFDVLSSDNDGDPTYRSQFSLNSPTEQIFNDPSLWATIEFEADHTFKIVDKDITAPSMPANVKAAVSHSTVTMTWDPSTDNIAVWSYDINVTGAIDTTFVFNPTNPTTNMVTFTNVANGVYNCSIVAVDNFGNKSLPSPIGAITVNYIAVSGIVISGGTTITSAGGTLALIATVTPGNATDDTVTWSVNNKTVATINAKTGLLTAVANGNVNVTATANDGSGVKASATITVSGQVSVPTLSAADLNLFPNPVIDVLHLSNTASINKIEICNANGQVVLMLRNSNEQMNINTSGLTNGIYFIRAYTNNNVITKQFVK